MMLRKMCIVYGQLPPSCAITDELRRIEDHPCGRGGSADIWRGVYRGSEVAIKVLRVNSRDLASLEKVRPFVSGSFNKIATCSDRGWDRGSVAKWSCGSSSSTQTCCS